MPIYLDGTPYQELRPALEGPPSHLADHLLTGAVLLALFAVWIFRSEIATLIKRLLPRKQPRPRRLVKIGERLIYPLDSSHVFTSARPPSFWERNWHRVIELILILLGITIGATVAIYTSR